MQSQKCPQCSLVNFSDDVNCKRCGLELKRSPIKKLIQPNLKSAEQFQQEKFSTACPKCACADTQSYEMAYQTGTSSGRINTLSYNADVGFIGTGGTVTNRTMLASQVSPPVASDETVEILVGFVLSIILLTITSIFLFSVIGVLGFPLGFVIIGGLVFGLYKLTKPTRQKNKLNYEQNIAKWSRSWICLRCGASWII